MKQFLNKGLQSCCIIVIIILLLSNAVLAEDESKFQTVQIFFENDLFGDTDKYYTNAVQLTWLSKDFMQFAKTGDNKKDPLPDWSLNLIKFLPFANEKNVRRNVGVILGQQIYTPEDIQESELIEDDRPYAGFFYGGLALHSKTIHENKLKGDKDKLDTIEIVLGIVGPWSLAEYAQNGVHEIRNIKTAKGWDNQLENELGFRFSWQRKWRLWEDRFFDFFDSDLITHTGLTLGNVRTSLNFGSEIRLGYNIPKDFGSDCIRPGAGVSAPFIDSSEHRFGFHVFASGQTEAVARDIFLDGNTFRDSHSIDKEILVADFSLGCAFIFDTYKITYRHLFRTNQFKGQRHGHAIGSITLTLSF